MTTQKWNASVNSVLDFLHKGSWRQLQCCLGFDGYVDDLYKVVEKREDQENIKYYSNIESFGKRIVMAAQKSADLEVVLKKRKIGGNGPILSNALSELGMQASCIGTMDTGKSENPFETMNSNCRRYSIGKASETFAMEFCDGKIMFGNLQGNYSTWGDIKNKIGLEKLRKIYRESALIAIVNWSGLYYVQEILEGFQEEVCRSLPDIQRKEKIFFFDMADPSVLNREKILNYLNIMRSYAKQAKVILGLNENEARIIGEVIDEDSNEPFEIGRRIREYLGAFQVVIHTNRHSFAFSEKEQEVFSGMHIRTPVISTGAGDHFNAGYITGALGGLGLLDSLLLGQAEASYYLSEGSSPTLEQLISYIQSKTLRR